MEFNFIVTYGEGWKCINVKFPDTPALIPDNKPFPSGELVKVASLGQAVLGSKQKAVPGWGFKMKNCTLIGSPIPTPVHGNEVKVAFNGDGLVKDIETVGGIKIDASKPVEFSKSNLTEVTQIIPIGELLVFKTSDGMLIRCLNFDGQIVKSLPSAE
ncbi:hypothetical protein PITCH_A720117 [uncultured Desulfobacterium sp.]|uniref:Uncharacterized protein n=1 Tax=uncultured Desulfobacterium sp. TaxID=201089 RepID=A0A445N246_9BACT|nr:hypothetical protein PITCH_A720117 [uncultured Desulfobacterium sp.]